MGTIDEANSRAPPAPPRLFFALWPDQRCRDALSKLGHQSIGTLRGKVVPAENLHLTLHFLGSVAPPLRPCVDRIAGAISVPAFVLNLDHAGYWPRPRVLWTAPACTPGALHTLVAALRKGLSTCGFHPDTRPYHAHLTLARKVRGPVAGALHAPIDWPIDAFHLVESRTLAAGARYRILRTWPLMGTAPTAPGHRAPNNDL